MSFRPTHTRPGALRLLLYLLCVCLPLEAHAQTPVPFSDLTLRLGGVFPGGGITLPGGWDEQTGIEASGSTPFYLGTIEASLRLTTWERLDPDLPDFASRSLALGWHLSLLSFTARTGVSVGWRVGLVQMDFDDPGTTWHDRVDHELETGPVLGFTVGLGNEWEFRLLAGRTVLWLSEPIDRTWCSLALGRRLRMPPWLREFLQ